LFRANTRNAVVLEKYLREKGAKALKAQGHSTPPVDPSDPDEFDRQMREELGPPPQYTTAPLRQGTRSHSNGHGQSTLPPQDGAAKERGGGWFSAFGSRNKQPDIERGGELRRREDEPLDSGTQNRSTL